MYLGIAKKLAKQIAVGHISISGSILRLRWLSQISSPRGIGLGGYMGTGHGLEEKDGLKGTILVTGAVGQVGSELVPALRERFGADRVIASDIKIPPTTFSEGPFVYLDVLNFDNLARVMLENRVSWVFHLASMLSVVGEMNPQLALKLNTRGVENVLELARVNKFRVFAPSTIAVFGPSTPKDHTPDDVVLRPTTIYGITKVYGEMLGEYFHRRFDVDFRSLRYPGIISYAALPGGGTTDFSVEIYDFALAKNEYRCFLHADTRLPMMYSPDAIRATIDLMEAPSRALNRRVYNITAMSFTPAEQAASIQAILPDFKITYEPDSRQAIAESWVHSVDDSNARNDWGWNEQFDLNSMSKHMIETLRKMPSRLA